MKLQFGLHPWRRRAAVLAAFCALAVTPLGHAQGEAAADWRMPFRKPLANLAPPEALWGQLEPMLRIAAEAPPAARRFDASGVEVVDDPEWQRHLTALRAMPIDDGYLSVVIRDSQFEHDRRIAFYAAFHVPDPRRVLALIEHIPGEPSRAIRQDAYLRAVEYLRVHLPRREGEGDDAGGGRFAHRIDPAPFVALLEIDDERDRLQALWFLARLAEIRPDLGREALALGRDRLAALVAGESQRVRLALRDFVAVLDPDDEREPPADDAGREAFVEWFQAVVHDVFPPIRRLSSGLVDLYPSPELDAIVAAGESALESGSIGTDGAAGKTKEGVAFRGFRLDTVPAPLDQLGLEHGQVITAVNGVPTPSGETLLSLLRRSLPRTRRFFVEYVDRQGVAGAVEFRRR